MLAESGAEPTKGCGACRQVLPRASYTDAQWANKKFRGEGRRCNACSSSNAMSCAAADTHATVVAAALRVGGPVGATFPDAWAVAWENVLRAVLKVDLGRLTAVLMRNLSACGTSKAEKVAHRALAEECWSLLCGRPIRAPSARAAPRSTPVGAGWQGGPGLLSLPLGKAGRGGKDLASEELIAAVTRHCPALCLGPDIATELAVFLPCRNPCPEPRALDEALATIRAHETFSRVHRVWAVHETASTAAEAAIAGRRLLSSALQALPGATFAIRMDRFPPSGAAMGRSELVAAIAAELDGSVDLACPDVSLLLRGFDVGGVRHCALSLDFAVGDPQHAPASGAVRWDHGDDTASEGRPYFVREAHGAPPPPHAGTAGKAGKRTADALLLNDAALPELLRRVEAALAAAAVLPPMLPLVWPTTAANAAAAAGAGKAEAGAEEANEEANEEAAGAADVDVGAVLVGQQPDSGESNTVRWRRRRAAGGTQLQALGAAIAGAGLLGGGTAAPAERAGETALAPRPDGSAPGPPPAGTEQRPLWTVEFGAGAGELSRQLAADAVPLATGPLAGQVLLDRSCGVGGAPQMCAGGKDRWDERDARLLGGRALRLRIDIRHLHLGGLDELRGARAPTRLQHSPSPHTPNTLPALSPAACSLCWGDVAGAAVTAVGKHVCGAATDLMLRCVVAAPGESAGPGPSSIAVAPIAAPTADIDSAPVAVGTNPESKPELKAETEAPLECLECLECRGIGVALCCHHLCNWEDYANPAFVTRAGLSPAEFGTVCRLSSWATNRSASGDPAQRRVGMVCKAFIDVGRCLYLRQHGFDASLVAYCSSVETPENRMLLATSRGP